MAVIDAANKVVTLKVVYYGCAMGGKTTNLATLHRLTDPNAEQGLVSIATQDDRTLFFDLLPMDLGRIGGLTVRAKVYTVPGQVHYETTRRQVLGGADAVVLVVDSTPDAAKNNIWAEQNMQENLIQNGLDPNTTTVILQWNKRDLPNARRVVEMNKELNLANRPNYEAVATSGAGVIETFGAALKGAIAAVYAKAGKSNLSKEFIDKTVDQALAQAQERAPEIPGSSAPTAGQFEHRVDMEAYREKWAEEGRDRRIMDQESLLREAVQSGMKLAERIDDLKSVHAVNERRGRLMEALAWLAPVLTDPAAPPVPPDTLKTLLEHTSRTHGSILLFAAKSTSMEERDVCPGGADPLNATVAENLGSTAYRMSRPGKAKLVEDLETEVFFGAAPPGAEQLSSAYLVPLACDGLAFGSIVIYARIAESGFDEVEQQFWDAVARFFGLSLHWRALRRKLAASKKPAAAGR